MKTLKQWNKRNRLILKGSKADGFTRSGNALFKKKQTQKMSSNPRWDSDRYIDYNECDYDIDYDECNEHLWLDPLNQ